MCVKSKTYYQRSYHNLCSIQLVQIGCESITAIGRDTKGIVAASLEQRLERAPDGGVIIEGSGVYQPRSDGTSIGVGFRKFVAYRAEDLSLTIYTTYKDFAVALLIIPAYSEGSSWAQFKRFSSMEEVNQQCTAGIND